MGADMWKKIFSLIRKTGDKVIVTGENGENPVVVISLEQYEQLLGTKKEARELTEEEMLDRINHDISLWQQEQEADDKIKQDFSVKETLVEKSEDEERYYVEPIE
jgi:PHD/YefM family antitoxin component YafN of YafNO toxin-antitoxin module